MCKVATSTENIKEVEAFRVVSGSVDTEKGNFFERLVACELTFLSSKFSERILSGTGLDVIPDPRMVATPFAYHARIHEADWTSAELYHRVLCVREEAKSVGRRLVDVGFPVIARKDGVEWKVYCELKVVQDKNKLWRMCWSFFRKMQELGVGQDGFHIVAVFISFHDFFALLIANLSHQQVCWGNIMYEICEWKPNCNQLLARHLLTHQSRATKTCQRDQEVIHAFN
jgi:hypothetical protein